MPASIWRLRGGNRMESTVVVLCPSLRIVRFSIQVRSTRSTYFNPTRQPRRSPAGTRPTIWQFKWHAGMEETSSSGGMERASPAMLLMRGCRIRNTDKSGGRGPVRCKVDRTRRPQPNYRWPGGIPWRVLTSEKS